MGSIKMADGRDWEKVEEAGRVVGGGTTDTN